MGRDYMDSAKAAAEADRIASVAEENFKQVVLSLKKCLQVVRNTKRMLEVDPECICAKSMNGQSKRERRDELDWRAKFIEYKLQRSLNQIESSKSCTKIETGLVESDAMLVQPKHPAIVGDDNLLWCDRVCVYEKVDMDSALWCTTPPSILELVFARLPLPQIFQLRGLSKQWRASIMSPSFQHAFGTTTSSRFAIVTIISRHANELDELHGFDVEPLKKGLWTFGTRERKVYKLPFDFLPSECDNPVAGDGGLLCCRHQSPRNCTKELYVCNPVTQAWRRLLLPSQVQKCDLVHMVTDKQTKQYTITVVSDDLHQSEHHMGSAKAIVEVYDSVRKTWNASLDGVLQSGSGNNLLYYKKYVDGKFVGIRVYNKTTGYSTSIPLDFFNVDDIIFSEREGFFPLVEHQGQMYMLRTDAATTSGVWVLRSPSHVWEKLYSVPKPAILKNFFVSLFVSADAIIICGDLRRIHVDDMDNMELPIYTESEDSSYFFYFWMLDRAQETWIDVTKHGIFCLYWSQIMFEMRLDAVP